MVSRENTVIAGFVIAAIVLAVSLNALTALPFEVVMGLMMVLGVIVPMVVNNYLDDQAAK